MHRGDLRGRQMFHRLLLGVATPEFHDNECDHEHRDGAAAKAQMMLGQIKYELEHNELLKRDCGIFHPEPGPWNATALYLERYHAKVSAVSIEQSMRSFRHANHRPQLIICDDLEDLESVKTLEQREKLHS